jgi:hypothetical protein
MKKQQMASFPGKKLSRNEMKNLSGGAAAGLWVCTSDGYECYKYKSQCQSACSVPSSCRFYNYCP